MFGPLIVRPEKTTGSKTGSWRVQSRPKFLKKNCIACKICLLACPEGCISGIEKNAFECDYTYCKGCGVCASLCPKADIEMVSEQTEGEKK